MKGKYQALLIKIDAIQNYLKDLSKTSEEKYLTTEEVCKLIKVSSRTVFEWRQRHLLPFIQIGSNIRYRLSDVEDFLAKYSVKSRSLTNEGQ